MSMSTDSFASEVDIGTGEDLTIAVTTSRVGKARRFREGVEEPPELPLEKSLGTILSVTIYQEEYYDFTDIQMLSAIPLRRPSKQRLLNSS